MLIATLLVAHKLLYVNNISTGSKVNYAIAHYPAQRAHSDLNNTQTTKETNCLLLGSKYAHLFITQAVNYKHYPGVASSRGILPADLTWSPSSSDMCTV